MQARPDEHILTGNVRKHLTTLYLSKTPIQLFFDLINKNIKNDFDLELQREFAECTFAHRLARKYPLSLNYRVAFVKKLMELIEDQQQETSPQVYEEYSDLMGQPTGAQADCYYVVRMIQDKYVVTKQSDAAVTQGTTGLRVWEGALQLFEQVFANKALFENKKIMELGAGNGFTGIALSKLCKLNGYIFTDHHFRVFQLLKENLTLNGFCSSDVVPTDRRLNKFFEFEDEEGNVSAKYYDHKDQDEMPYKCMDNSTSYFLDKKGLFGDNKDRDRERDRDTDDEPQHQLADNQDLGDKSDLFDQNVQDLTDKLHNFEEFLDNFKEKLTLMDEKLHEIIQIPDNHDDLSEPGPSKDRNDDYDDTNENLTKNVIVCELDWTWAEADIRKKFEEHRPDFLIGSDIVYDPVLIPELIKVIRVALDVLPDLEILVVCSVRNKETLAQFNDHLKELKKYHDVTYKETPLASRLSIFKHLPCSQSFVLYNISNHKNDDTFKEVY